MSDEDLQRMSTSSTQRSRTPTNSGNDARRALLQRVLGSVTFSKTERLSSFLSYICEVTLSGRASELNEQRIGTAVFGRPQDYDSTIDAIVRPQASRLRLRLDAYFSSEGADERHGGTTSVPIRELASPNSHASRRI